MALPKTDSFTSANQDLDLYDGDWVDMLLSASELRIVSNRVETGAAFGDSLSNWFGDLPNADQSVTFTLRTWGQYVGGALRLGGVLSINTIFGYLWIVGTGSVFRIENSGAQTQIASGWTSTNTDGDLIYFEIVGTTLTGKINGTTAGTTTDGSYASGRFGLFASGANHAAIDDFIGDSVPPTTTSSFTPPMLFLRPKPWRGKRRAA